MEKDFNEKISSLQNKLVTLEQQQDLGSNRSEMLEQQLKSRQEQCDKNEREITRFVVVSLFKSYSSHEKNTRHTSVKH